ncbi:MAG: hypothetical protein EOO10_07215 [Chitinophagaceae bacterium]|nr:MAG: hypothetical protein EOO10_07215 [Chitinophagaceae bacterium]
MRLKEFRSLKKNKQIDTIKSKAALLFVRQQGCVDVILYQLDGFYVEVYFDADENGSQITSFDETDLLDIYLKDVNISAVQQLL